MQRCADISHTSASGLEAEWCPEERLLLLKQVKILQGIMMNFQMCVESISHKEIRNLQRKEI